MLSIQKVHVSLKVCLYFADIFALTSVLETTSIESRDRYNLFCLRF